MEWCILQNLLSCLCGLYCLSAFFLLRKTERQHLFRKKSKLCFFLSYYFYCLRFLLDYNVALWFWDGKKTVPCLSNIRTWLYAIVANNELKRLMDHISGKQPSSLLLNILNNIHFVVTAEPMILTEYLVNKLTYI